MGTGGPPLTMPADGRRIVITGTGRAGTTFLVQLFTELGFDTGFSPVTAQQGLDAIAHAGLEHKLLDGGGPYVIKSPWFSDELATALTAGQVRIRTAILPMRELRDAAESRRRVFREALKAGHDPFEHPGSLVHTRRFNEQEMRLARQFYDALLPLVIHDVPVVLLHFPRLVQDPAYLFDRLRALMTEHGIDWELFRAAFAAVARPELVHAPGLAPSLSKYGDRAVQLRLLLARLKARLGWSKQRLAR